MKTTRLARAVAMLASVALLTGCAWIAEADQPISGSAPNAAAQHWWLSGNGRYVFFDSPATNLVASTAGTEPFINTGGIYRRDNKTGKTALLLPGAHLPQDPGVSQDLRYVLNLTNSGGYRVLDRTTGTNQPVIVDSDEVPFTVKWLGVTLSANGRYVAFQLDRPGDIATYVRDLQTGTTKLVATVPEGTDNIWQGFFLDALSLSRDGSVLSQATCSKSQFGHGTPDCTEWTHRLIDVTNSTAEQVLPDQPSGFQARLNGDGSLLAYRTGGTGNGSVGTDLRDVWVYNRNTEVSTIVDVGFDGQPTSGYAPAISSSGRYVAFESSALNVVPGVTPVQGRTHVYIRDRSRGVTTLVSANDRGEPDFFGSYSPVISADGRYVTFGNYGQGLTPDAAAFGPRVYTKAALIPRITSVSPTSGAPGTAVVVTLIGYGFTDDVKVFIDRAGTYLDVSGLGPSEMLLRFVVTIPADAPRGAYDVSAYSPGGGPGPTAGAGAKCIGCFTVTP